MIPSPHVHPQGETPRYCPRCSGGLEKRLLRAGEPERLVCKECGAVHYLDPKVVAGVVLVREGRVLLLRRAHEPLRGRWVIPSGYVDRGETVEAAARRETREETGLNPILERLLGVYSYAGEEVVVIVWSARGEGDPSAGDEALEIGWFAAEAIPWSELAFRSTREALEAWAGSGGS